ncbi:meiotic activator RIM4 [Fusarium heterosporum]|uniref:Meiotic activator RIM4 n=1 Tax=Fusarium heterosporum TaxID=42747 RepID=A0A8H5TSU7_FUSHE|nr:meiotic activator RIM4 [Fusarium heterosporum]
MSSPEYRRPRAPAASERELRNAFTALGLNDTSSENGTGNESSNEAESPRPLKSVKSLPTLPKSVYKDGTKRHWGSPVSDAAELPDLTVTKVDQPKADGAMGQEEKLTVELTTQRELVQNIANLPGTFDAQIEYPAEACLFVANLPQNFDDDTIKTALTKIFGKYGVNFVKMKRDRRRMPFAFVQYTDVKHADVAVEKARGELVLGRPCRTERCGGSLTYIIFRKNNRRVLPDEARAIFSRFGEVDKVEPLDYRIQKQMGVPPCLLIHFLKFDPRRDVTKGVSNMTAYHVMAYDPKMYEDRSDRAAGDQNFMETYDKDSRSIFFGGLPPNADETVVHTLASLCGDVISIDIRSSPDNNGGPPHVYAFVEFTLPTSPDEAVRQFNGRVIQGCLARVERKRAQPTNDTRMFPSPLRPRVLRAPIRPHRRGASMASTPNKHHLSQQELYQADSEYQYRKFMESQAPISPKSMANVPSQSWNEGTPLQSPDKVGSIAASETAVRWASSPAHAISPAGSSPVHVQQLVPVSETNGSHLLPLSDRIATEGRPVTIPYSRAAENAAERSEVANDGKTKNGQTGHQRAASMFAKDTAFPVLDISESDDNSSWRNSASSQDEKDLKLKKDQARRKLHRKHVSDQNLKRNQSFHRKIDNDKLKRSHRSEENLRDKRVSLSRENLDFLGTSENHHRSPSSSKMSRKSDATMRPPEGQSIVSSQQTVYNQQPAQPAPYPQMAPQYPPPILTHPMDFGGMPMQPSAPGGLAYMEMPYGPGAQHCEPFSMYQGPSQGQYPIHLQGQYRGPSQMFHDHPQASYQGHPQAFQERGAVYSNNRQIQYQSPLQAPYTRRVVSYAPPPQLTQYRGPSQQAQNQRSYDDMSYSSYGSNSRGPESDHQRRQRLEAARYNRYTNDLYPPQ